MRVLVVASVVTGRAFRSLGSQAKARGSVHVAASVLSSSTLSPTAIFSSCAPKFLGCAMALCATAKVISVPDINLNRQCHLLIIPITEAGHSGFRDWRRRVEFGLPVSGVCMPILQVPGVKGILKGSIFHLR